VTKSNSFYAWPFKSDNVSPWAYWTEAFSNEECDKIIEYSKQYTMYNGKVGMGTTQNESVTGSISYVVDNEMRNSKVAFFGTNDLEWVFERLTDIVLKLNEDYFKFNLWGFAEGLQFTEYCEPGGHYDYHIDLTKSGPVRKLSIVVQLSDPAEYDNGDLELVYCNRGELLPKTRGLLIAFPSYTLHRVVPVTRGKRNSLVGWITGEPFK